METIYGESPEIQAYDGYATNGRIALFSAENGGETITSSDQDGEHVVGGKILWTITNNGNGNYSGGITNSGWRFEDYEGFNPFSNYTESEIWGIASRNRNLNVIFDQFEDIYLFAHYIDTYHHQCIAGKIY